MAFTANPAVHFDADVIDSDPYTVFGKARSGNLGAIASAMSTPHFTINGTSTTSTSASLQALNLSDLGVPFAADTMREVVAKCWARSDAGTSAMVEVRGVVLGGTTPILVDQATEFDGDGDLDVTGGSFSVTGGEVVFGVITGGISADVNWLVEVYVNPAKFLDDPT